MSGADDEWMAAYDAWEVTRDRMRNEFIEDARARFARDRIVSVESYGDEVRFTSSLTKATRPGVAYQVTDFEGDEPIGHHEYENLDDALGGLWDLASPRTKGVPPVPNPRCRAGTQMSGLPVEHAKAPEGGPLCGAKPRRWGSLYAQYQDEVSCARCKKKLEQGAESATWKRPDAGRNPSPAKGRWWRGGPLPTNRPIWLAASKKYAKFYGVDIAQCDVDGKILDLTRLGVDIKVGSLRSIVGDLADTGTSSGEMYEWAEHVWPELRDRGWNGVAVMQWHASFGDDPQLTLLVFDATSVSCGRKRNPSRYRYLGTDDEASDCSCCGKRGLKRVAWLAELDEYGTEIGEAAPYGTTCASMLIQEGHKDPSKKKPTKSQAEKELMQAWRISVQEAWDRAKLLTPPDPTFSKTSFGTAMIYVGDAGQPRTIRSYRGEGEEPNYQPAEYDLVWLNQEWRKRRAIEIGREMGIIEISLGSFGGVKNPSGRLRRTGARISNP